MSSERKSWEVTYPAQDDPETARECVGDVQVQLDVILIQLAIAARDVAAREATARNIGCSKRAIEIARTHLALARAQLEAVLEAGPSASAEGRGRPRVQDGETP